MNPLIRYTYRSRNPKCTEVIIKSRLGEDSARSAAMIHFWGPLPDPAVPSRKGLGLLLTAVEEVQ
jgi:hypothetical protein